MSLTNRRRRVRALLEAIVAGAFYILASGTAHRAAVSAATESWAPLFEQILRLLALLVLFFALGRIFTGQKQPLREQGLDLRSGWRREGALGMAYGWALAVICVLPLTIVGGISVVLLTGWRDGAWLLIDLLFFLLLTLSEELAFRGYGFQRLIAATGPFTATMMAAVVAAIAQLLVPGSSRASVLVAVVTTIILSTAYLRTRALWVSWGINFGWKASRALLFGLAVKGDASHSPVIEGNPMGPFWLTGGGYGLDGSWWTLLVLAVALPFLFTLTRDLDFVYNAPVLIPGGYPMEGDACAPAPSAPAPAALVQIQPLAEAPATALPVGGTIAGDEAKPFDSTI